MRKTGQTVLLKGNFISISSSVQIFWGELIDKYKDINANSKTVFTDYAMLKLVHIVPIYF